MTPITKISFLDSWTGFKADSLIVKSAAQQADAWYARLHAILHQQSAAVPPAIASAGAAPRPLPSPAEQAASELRRREIMDRIEYKRARRERQAGFVPEVGD